MGKRKKSLMPSNQSQQDVENNYLDRLHPSLRANFFPLPDASDLLTDEQLAEVFGGDWKALRDVIRLAPQNVQESMD
ncbi:MAG: hypothetical protein RLP44_23175 [Aggregatilineales bacterium]